MKQMKISIKGILFGCLVDWAFSLGLGMIIGIVAAIVSIVRNGMPDNSAMFVASIMTPGLYGFALVTGFLGTILGGFVAGIIAKRYELLNAGLMGLISLLTAIPFMGKNPLIYNVAGYGLTIPFAILGGYLASKNNMSNQKLQPIMKTPVEPGKA